MAEKRKTAEARMPAKTSGEGARALHPFLDLRREVDHLFDDFFSSDFSWRPFGRRLVETWPFERLGSGPVAPRFDVVETDAGYEISAELPGMDERGIEVTVSDGILMLKGEKKEEKEEQKKSYYLSERRHGAIQRSIALPEGVDEEKISATFDKGVLTLSLPKTPERKKPIQTIKVAKK